MNHLKLAQLISRCATHFDELCCKLPDEHKVEAALHVELLHDAAAVLAGDDINQVYSPDENLRYSPIVHYQNTVNFGGESIGLCHSRSMAGEVTASMIISTGPFSVALFATPHKVREFVLALRELLDQCDASAAQHAAPLSISQAAGQCVACEAI